jgi:hypothetical protein
VSVLISPPFEGERPGRSSEIVHAARLRRRLLVIGGRQAKSNSGWLLTTL